MDGILKLAREVAAEAAEQLIFLSSIKVIGESKLPRQSFTADEANTQDPYGV